MFVKFNRCHQRLLTEQMWLPDKMKHITKPTRPNLIKGKHQISRKVKVLAFDDTIMQYTPFHLSKMACFGISNIEL